MAYVVAGRALIYAGVCYGGRAAVLLWSWGLVVGWVDSMIVPIHLLGAWVLGLVLFSVASISAGSFCSSVHV